MKSLLGSCCGLAGTELGSVDFTGCWFLEEPYAVFRPALTLAIDDAERRWIAEVGNHDLPGPVWCVFPHPEVALRVSDDLAGFLTALRDRTCRGEAGAWLQSLASQARAVWAQRHAAAMRPHEAHRTDRAIRGWLTRLPPDAYVYDLRMRSEAPGWPYGVAGPAGRLYRCGRLPVFAVAGLPAQGWRAPHPRARGASVPSTTNYAASFAVERLRSRRLPRLRPELPARWPTCRRAAAHAVQRPARRDPGAAWPAWSCA